MLESVYAIVGQKGRTRLEADYASTVFSPELTVR